MADVELPKSVKVGAWTYTIEAWSEDDAKAQDLYGKTLHTIQRIWIDTGHSHQRQATTLLHEILHCICKQWVIEKGDDQERQVWTLELALAAVWRDNPEVMAWIHAGLACEEDA